LLLNIALHGMEAALGVRYNAQGYLISSRAVVRYADDLVVFCESKQDAEAVVKLLTDWLQQRGLALSAEKTRIVHLTEGFDFLGFTIRQYKAPRTTRTGYKLRITPSKQSVQALRAKLREQWLSLQGVNVLAVMHRLNPLIRGWANYYRGVVAMSTFRKLDHWLFQRAVRYAKRTHPNKSWSWLKRRYWGKLNPQRNDTWVFGDKHTGWYLLKFSWFSIERHVLVRAHASPDDPRLHDYWERREQAKAGRLDSRRGAEGGRPAGVDRRRACRLPAEPQRRDGAAPTGGPRPRPSRAHGRAVAGRGGVAAGDYSLQACRCRRGTPGQRRAPPPGQAGAGGAIVPSGERGGWSSLRRT